MITDFKTMEYSWDEFEYELGKEQELREILQDYPLPELGIYAVLPGNRHIPHRLRVLMDFLVERLADGERPAPA